MVAIDFHTRKNKIKWKSMGAVNWLPNWCKNQFLQKTHSSFGTTWGWV